jgi:hypothetical protein
VPVFHTTSLLDLVDESMTDGRELDGSHSDQLPNLQVTSAVSPGLLTARGCVGTRLAPSNPFPRIIRFAVVSGAAISSVAAEFEAVVVPRHHAV